MRPVGPHPPHSHQPRQPRLITVQNDNLPPGLEQHGLRLQVLPVQELPHESGIKTGRHAGSPVPPHSIGL